jgi:hypothetical protein
MAGQGLRPPSRHKDPPQNTGLDLPDYDQDDLPSLDEDSDSSEEFEIELAKASRSRPVRQNMNPSSQFVNSKPGSNNFFGGVDTSSHAPKVSERASGAGNSKP